MSLGSLSAVESPLVLHPRQEKVVREGAGFWLVLGAAGCGKTEVLIHRVAYLLSVGVPAETILLVSSSSLLAKGMVQRVAKIIGFFPAILAGTFYQTGLEIVRRFRQRENYTLLDEDEALSLLGQVCGELLSREHLPDSKVLLEVFTRSVNSQEKLRDIVNLHYPHLSSSLPSLERVYREYCNKKKVWKLIDKNDVLLDWYRAVRNEEFGYQMSSAFRYILVDDYQNITRLQSQILYQMSRVHKNLLAMADDAQMVDSKEGSSLNHLLEFPRIYPGARVYFLKVNFTATPEILSLSSTILSYNSFQFPREIISQRKNGVKPVLVKCSGFKEEAEFVCRRIIQLLQAGVDPEEIAVLFRSRVQVAELEIELSREKIPYYVSGETLLPLTSRLKDLGSFLLVRLNPKNELAWRRILSLRPGIGPATRKKILELVQTTGDWSETSQRLKTYPWSRRRKEAVDNLLKVFENLKPTSSPGENFSFILEQSRQGNFPANWCSGWFSEEFIELTRTTLSCFESWADFLAWLGLEDFAVVEADAFPGRVTLSSIHGSRGRHWLVVFLIGLCSPYFPDRSATQDPALLEEERRLFYLAVTRTREDLYLTCYPQETKKGVPLNQPLFLREIQSANLEKWEGG
ncbi:MAG: ATP-dependent helicase [Candidatus Omnitrophica bacterium]|nr:ATP-dependent helicase [Candidatus Omnitrophota bacterium]